jgi:hypothetical protein
MTLALNGSGVEWLKTGRFEEILGDTKPLKPGTTAPWPAKVRSDDRDRTLINDQLGVDGIKLINHYIVFIKPGFEAVLLGGWSEVINYPTDEANFCGRKIAEFMARMERDGIPRPDLWHDKMYPPRTADPYRVMLPEIPYVDRQYIHCVCEVVWVLPKQKS